MTAIGTRRTTGRSAGDRAEGGLPTTSAHPRTVPDGSDDGDRVAELMSPPPAGPGADPSVPPPALGEVLRRYGAGASVRALANELGVSFDWVARRVIDAGERREPRSRRARRRPPELDSDSWLSEQLANGAGVGDLSRRLHVSTSTVRNALRHHAARLTEQGAAGVGDDVGPSDPERRFAVATDRVEQANAALERARHMQASAVGELQQSGLTIAAIADRLGADDALVESLLAVDLPPDGA